MPFCVTQAKKAPACGRAPSPTAPARPGRSSRRRGFRAGRRSRCRSIQVPPPLAMLCITGCTRSSDLAKTASGVSPPRTLPRARGIRSPDRAAAGRRSGRRRGPRRPGASAEPWAVPFAEWIGTSPTSISTRSCRISIRITRSMRHAGPGLIGQHQRIKRQMPGMFARILGARAIGQRRGAQDRFQPVRLVQKGELRGQPVGQCPLSDGRGATGGGAPDSAAFTAASRNCRPRVRPAARGSRS